MRKGSKITITVAISLFVIGCIISIVSFSLLGWDFAILSTQKYETNTYTINESFEKISIDATTGDVNFVITQDNSAFVVCHESEKLTHSVSVENNTLTITSKDNREWFDFIGFSFSSPKITVSVPQKFYSLIEITLTTGDVNLSSLTLDELSIDVTTANIKIENLECNNITTNGSTGDINLKNVVANQKITIERTTGNVEFDSIDANEIYVKTTTGDIEGTILSQKHFSASTTTGKIRVPNSSSSEECTLITTTGNIEIKIK